MDAFWRTLAAIAVIFALLWGVRAPSLVAEPEHALLVGLRDVPDDLAPGATLHGARVAWVNPTLSYAVVVTSTPGLVAFAARLDPNVRYVEEDRPVPLLAGAPGPRPPVPNDALFASQYALQRIRAPEAWDLARDSGERSLCVIDSGLRASHDEFRDGRLVAGWDFVEGDPVPQDREGHGTHVAGIAAAATGNLAGISGVSSADLLVARTHSQGWSTTNRTATAIQWCVDEGADVVSMSFGAQTTSETWRAAVAYAWERGRLLVAAAGNGHNCADCVNHPAAFPEVIAVTNTDALDQLDAGSSTGPEAELAAPGSRILSAWSNGDDKYWTESGTSMSAPHVSGVAALVWNHEPRLPAGALRDILVETARDVGDPGRDELFGFGIVDARAALETVWPASLPVCRILEPARHDDMEAAPALRGLVQLRAWTRSPESAIADVTAEVAGLRLTLAETEEQGVYATTLDASLLPPGEHAVALRCAEADGSERTHARSYAFG